MEHIDGFNLSDLIKLQAEKVIILKFASNNKIGCAIQRKSNMDNRH